MRSAPDSMAPGKQTFECIFISSLFILLIVNCAMGTYEHTRLEKKWPQHMFN